MGVDSGGVRRDGEKLGGLGNKGVVGGFLYWGVGWIEVEKALYHL